MILNVIEQGFNSCAISEIERSQLKEDQLDGIRFAKARYAYTGRKSGTNEDVHSFLSKPKNRKALEYIKRGMSHTEAAKLAGIHINTMTKIKKLGIRKTL